MSDQQAQGCKIQWVNVIGMANSAKPIGMTNKARWIGMANMIEIDENG